MSLLGTYVSGESTLHRAPVGAKLLGLAAGVTALLQVRSALWLGVATAVIVALFALARVPPLVALTQLRPVLWILVAVAGFQMLVAGWERALVVVGQLTLAVAAAALVTLTTRVSAMLDALERALGPLRRIGVDPGRVALVMALTIRAVPVITQLAQQVREAQLARGLSTSPKAFAVPLLVRTLRHADALGEAMAARGLDD